MPSFHPPAGTGELIAKALSLGASNAVLMPASAISPEQSLADLCSTCPNLGKSLSCPPHVSGPKGFKQWLATYTTALFFKIEVPVQDLLSPSSRGARQAFSRLHDMAALLENETALLGFDRARGFAGGACKSVFCHDKEACPALDPPGKCLYPDRARPSMSGFGINVSKLLAHAGWPREPLMGGKAPSPSDTAGIYGLMLIG